VSTGSSSSEVFLTPQALLEHWQGHRRVTRRVIEAFPEDKFTTFSVGGMRPLSLLAVELLRMDVPTVRGVITDTWSEGISPEARPKAEVLRLWDEPTIPAARFQQTLNAFGQWKMPGHALIMYIVDNEIHHRAQGYVYLRALGIEPPHFWER